MPRELSHLHVLAFCVIDHAVSLDERLRPHGVPAYGSLGLPLPNLPSGEGGSFMTHLPSEFQQWEHFIPDRGGQTCHVKPEPVRVFSEGDMQAAQERAEKAEREYDEMLSAHAIERARWASADERAGVFAEALRDLTEAVDGGPNPSATEDMRAATLRAARARALAELAGSPRSHELVPLGTEDALRSLVAAADASFDDEAGASAVWQRLTAALTVARALVEGVEPAPTPGIGELLLDEVFGEGVERTHTAEPLVPGAAARADALACPRCGGLPSGEASGAGDLCVCAQAPTPSGITDEMVQAVLDVLGQELVYGMTCDAGSSSERKSGERDAVDLVRKGLAAALELQAGSSEGHRLVPTRVLKLTADWLLIHREGLGLHQAFREAARPGGRPQWPETGDAGQVEARPPASFWHEVPCGHPPDPVAWVHPDGHALCHCGWLLDPARGREVEEAPGPVINCGKCGCHVAVPVSRPGTGDTA